jgi:hypothetical protein
VNQTPSLLGSGSRISELLAEAMMNQPSCSPGSGSRISHWLAENLRIGGVGREEIV